MLHHFSRLFARQRREAYAQDEVALTLARALLEGEEDQQLPPLERLFLYLPFLSSENKADQAIAQQVVR